MKKFCEFKMTLDFVPSIGLWFGFCKITGIVIMLPLLAIVIIKSKPRKHKVVQEIS